MQGSGTAKLTSPGAALHIPGSNPHKLNARYNPFIDLPIQYDVKHAGYQHLYCRHMSLIDKFYLSLQ